MSIAEALRLVGEKEIREKTMREFACRLLKMGMDLADIQKPTKFEINQIKALQAELV